LRHLGIESPGRDLVSRPREGQHRPREAPREIPDQPRCNYEPGEESEAHATEEYEPAGAQLRPRLCHDERPERVSTDRNWIGGREIGAIRPGRHEFEGLDMARGERRPIEKAAAQRAQPGALAGEDLDAR